MTQYEEWVRWRLAEEIDGWAEGKCGSAWYAEIPTFLAEAYEKYGIGAVNLMLDDKDFLQLQLQKVWRKEEGFGMFRWGKEKTV